MWIHPDRELLLNGAEGIRRTRRSAGLKPDEYDAVALIYNQELSALGNRALFPICIGMPSGMPAEPLVRYLRKGGFEISDESVCEPAMTPGGQHHPKDYSHGLRIFIDKLQRDSAGVMTMRVQDNRTNTFYLHNSHKGYTHGCVETCDELYDRFVKLHDQGVGYIDVDVRYAGNSTNGGTKQ